MHFYTTGSWWEEYKPWIPPVILQYDHIVGYIFVCLAVATFVGALCMPLLMRR